MKVSVAPYQNKFSKSRNVLSSENLTQGLLLKLETENSVGYSSYQAFAEFGDLTTDEVIAKIKRGDFSGPCQLLLKYAEQDAQDRRMQHDPLAGFFQLENHYLFSSIDEIETEDLDLLKAKGFRYLKIKMGRDPQSELIKLKELTEELHQHKFKVRLDFNKILPIDEFARWIHKLSGYEKEIIDFIEDPCVYDCKQWQAWQRDQDISLAIDINTVRANENYSGAKVLVLKPARFNIIEFLKTLQSPKDHRYVVTHNMDHMIGLAHAAATAMKLQFFVRERLDVCGLLPFSGIDYTGWPVELKGPHLLFNGGEGVGFAEQLAKQAWDVVYEC